MSVVLLRVVPLRASRGNLQLCNYRNQAVTNAKSLEMCDHLLINERDPGIENNNMLFSVITDLIFEP